MEKRCTIADVARAAGVSKQTVSRVLNNKGELSAATRERILAVIKELGELSKITCAPSQLNQAFLNLSPMPHRQCKH